MKHLAKIAQRLIIALILTYLYPSVAFAQLHFESTTHDFGTIAEAGGKVRCTFTATNQGAQPIVITDVVTTCGCTVPSFSRKPILPGEKSPIEVVYDPYGRPGAFNRKLYVYNAKHERLAVLTICGEVTPREQTIEERYPIELGNGVRASSTLCSFTYIYLGKPIRAAISIVNTASEPRQFALQPSIESGFLNVEYPTTLAAGEQSAINFCYEVPLEKAHYGTLRDALHPVIEEVKSDKVLVTHGIAVDLPTKTTKESPPKMELSENILKFGAVKRSKTGSKRLVISNTGSSDLVIRATECGTMLATSLKAGEVITAGDSLEGEVWLDTAKADYGFTTAWLVFVTNDPIRPMRRVRVTAIVED